MGFWNWGNFSSVKSFFLFRKTFFARAGGAGAYWFLLGWCNFTCSRIFKNFIRKLTTKNKWQQTSTKQNSFPLNQPKTQAGPDENCLLAQIFSFLDPGILVRFWFPFCSRLSNYYFWGAIEKWGKKTGASWCWIFFRRFFSKELRRGRIGVHVFLIFFSGTLIWEKQKLSGTGGRFFFFTESSSRGSNKKDVGIRGGLSCGGNFSSKPVAHKKPAHHFQTAAAG